MFRNPFLDFLATLLGVAAVLLLLLYLTGNIHCWNLPIAGLRCVVG